MCETQWCKVQSVVQAVRCKTVNRLCLCFGDRRCKVYLWSKRKLFGFGLGWAGQVFYQWLGLMVASFIAMKTSFSNYTFFGVWPIYIHLFNCRKEQNSIKLITIRGIFTNA